jgi:anionic cell wall polymer biosynthesis LytR-Cps2A-Psr (LCP) family protein
MQFVDAIGGVTINVPRRIPVGGHRDPETGIQTGVTSYIKPGHRKLNGYQALWFARSRSDSDDFERMRRQRCVIGALTAQADPQNLALGLPGIMRAAKDNIRTNIRITDVDAWVTLALRVQKAHVRSLPFTNAVIASGDPDFDRMRELVQQAITEPVPTAAATPTPTVQPSPSATTKRSPKATATPQQDPEKAVDVKAVC